MSADGYAAGATLPSAESILDKIDLPAGWSDLERKSGKFVVPKKSIPGICLGLINDPFGDVSGRHLGLLLC
jgi:hypothetical protein